MILFLWLSDSLLAFLLVMTHANECCQGYQRWKLLWMMRERNLAFSLDVRASKLIRKVCMKSSILLWTCDEDVDACSILLTLKNQAPDFFHISRCSAHILHSQIVDDASWWSLEAEPCPPKRAELINEVIEEDMDEEEAKEDPRCPCWLPPDPLPGPLLWHSRPHLPQVILAHSMHRFCEWW